MKKRFGMPGEFWDTGLLEQWLEEKAAQGWTPLSFRGYSSGKFERTEPRSLRFRLEPDRPESYEDKCDRESAYQEMGWQFTAILGDYRVYCTGDPQAPELYTDPVTQSLAWERQLKKLRRNGVIYILLLVVWTVWQFRSLWEKDAPVETFLLGMWAVWLFVLYFFLRELIHTVRRLRGIRRVKRQLQAGIPLDHSGDLARSLRRRRLGEVWSWTMDILLAVFMLSVVLGASSMELAEAPQPLPCVAMETLDPGTAGLEMDWARYRERRSPLMPFSCQIEQWQWAPGPVLAASFYRTLFPAFAEALYQEQLGRYIKANPHAEAEVLEDSRFDGAVLATVRREDGEGSQVFIAWKGRAAIYERVAGLNADLGEHIGEFAAILAEEAP